MTEHRSGEGQDPQPREAASDADGGVARRRFLATSSTIAMGGGLVAGYGTFLVIAGRFLYPSRSGVVAWQFLATIDELAVGESFTYTSPTGVKVVVARQGDGEAAEDFIALSSVCPHLGCQVHWEPQNDRFFCPCHNGAFDRQGCATAGPPAAAGQELSRFPLRVENGLIFIEVPTESVTAAGGPVAQSQARPGGHVA